MHKTTNIADLDLSVVQSVRQALNGDRVTKYATDIERGDTFPRVVIFADDSGNWVADGWHRIEASRSISRTEIDADVRAGGRLDALRYAAGCNDSHGLERSREDKLKTVMSVLGATWKDKAGHDVPGVDFSDNYLAEMCRVSDGFVANVRRSLGDRPESSETPPAGRTDGKKVGKDGKARAQPTRRGDADESGEIDGKAPKPGVEAFEMGAYTEHLSRAMRELDKLAIQYGKVRGGKPSSPQHKELSMLLNQGVRLASSWHKALVKEAKK